MVDADLLSDFGDFVGDVSHGDGGESTLCDSDSELDKPNDWVVGLGQSCDCAGFGVVGDGAVDLVCDLPANSEIES